jgi:hypothetical protein
MARFSLPPLNEPVSGDTRRRCLLWGARQATNNLDIALMFEFPVNMPESHVDPGALPSHQAVTTVNTTP